MPLGCRLCLISMAKFRLAYPESRDDKRTVRGDKKAIQHRRWLKQKTYSLPFPYRLDAGGNPFADSPDLHLAQVKLIEMRILQAVDSPFLFFLDQFDFDGTLDAIFVAETDDAA